MTDRVDNIADLHEELLIFLLDYKKHNKTDLTFMLRSTDSEHDREALGKGWWFKGNDKFVNVYFLENFIAPIYIPNVQLTMSRSGWSIQIYFARFYDVQKISDFFAFIGRIQKEGSNRNTHYTIYPTNQTTISQAIKAIEDYINSPNLLEEYDTSKVEETTFQNNLQYIQNLRRQNRKKKICLNSFSIKNYHSIQSTAIENLSNETRWIFLAGENGAGKTLVLQALALGLYGNNEKSNLFKVKQTIIKTEYTSVNLIRNITYHKSNGDYFHSLQNLVGYSPFRLDIQNEASENQESKRSSPIYGLFGNYDVVLKNIETELKFAYHENRKKFEHLIKMLKQVIPTLHDIEFDVKNRKIYYYERNVYDKNEVYEKTNYSELATGIKSIIAMVGDIYIRFSKNQLIDEFLPPEELYGIVIIDELDLHLHPKWQKNLPYLLSNVFPNIQFIASTHSAIPILGAPENSVLLRVNRSQEDGITVERLEHLEKELKNLTPNLILTSEIFGMQDIFPNTHNESERIRTEDTMDELKENEELMEALKSYKGTDKEDELLKLFSK